VFSDEAIPWGGFADSTGLVILATRNAAFSAYDLTTSIGPVTGTGVINSTDTFSTNEGSFSFTSVTGNATFTATVVPEPATVALFGLGLAGLALSNAGRSRSCESRYCLGAVRLAPKKLTPRRRRLNRKRGRVVPTLTVIAWCRAKRASRCNNPMN